MNDRPGVDLTALVKAYDVRGTVPDQLDEELARLFGAAFVVTTGADAIVTGHDMRPSSPALARAFAHGAAAQGADVTEIGLCSTDELYFAGGTLDRAGAMFTASHNPARYNGIKMCRAGAAPVGQDTGLREIRTLVERWAAGERLPEPRRPQGSITRRDMLDAYAAHLLSLVDVLAVRPLRIVVDAGNGMSGLTVPAVFRKVPVEIVPLYFELDGTFPHHEANPLDPANIVDLQRAVREHQADLGLAFDGDADRCFVVDENGDAVTPSAVTALIAARLLADHPGSTVLHNLITSRAVPEVVRQLGGTPVRTRVGHSFIKAEMTRTHAVFGGEHSAHYYFRDFYNADTGMLAALHVVAALGSQPRPLSELIRPYQRYPSSGEINTAVTDPSSTLAAVRDHFAAYDGTSTDDLDGLTVSTPTWWFNLRPSNTEPLLRLNVEATDVPTLDRVRDEVLALVRTGGMPSPGRAMQG
ncbi:MULTISPECIES: phosphomannomutase/phosphoglucomutase [Streptomyces]|uniref:Phosphomannomutase/phosphoglucomutase n=1 Tax=Streptomyces spinosisporus TaxID=2927582 RepID=A0ABS9XHN6_9ACTN|nr:MULTISPECIES: phosphomannomutase/phosphoglucomutase [Streptomyces]MCI3241583.1 phosphomannomutase/phosphoglucomutase [Streptomyces spinosisporus]WUB33608.1 phosphomannomutase/phosphoglucomutase [Streptomyces sp. NBC_00588]